MPISLFYRYRIASNGGILFVRDMSKGEIVGRIASEMSTHVAAHTGSITAACKHCFEGRITRIRHEGDTISVECEIGK